MITLDNLTYSYRRGADALSDVSARIAPGIHLLLGENGAGKTTLLKVIAGLLYPRQGACLIDGVAVNKRQPETLTKLFYLGDNMTFPAPTINTMVRIHALFYPTFNAERLSANLAMFGMNGDEDLASLSLGNRHKAQAAYALALGTPILLMDEPANGLDITSKQALAKIMSQCLNEDQTIIVSTHTVNDLQSLFDGVIVLSHSRILLAMPTWRITGRIAFRASMTKPDQPLYTEQRFGLYRTIEINSDGEETPLDYTLLYNSLMSSESDKVLQHINSIEQ